METDNESNIILQKSFPYKDKVCCKCGRGINETILNIEGFIHHNTDLLCIDTKNCNKAVRKLNKRCKRS